MRVSKLAVSALASLVATVQAEPCTQAQLAGNFNSFRFTGGGGAYASGTQQVVSFDRPLGSPVVALTDLDVVAVVGGTSYEPTILSGIPAAYTPNGPDEGSSVSLVLPNTLGVGAYFYRATLTSGQVFCTLDSVTFSIVGSTPTCTDDTRRCESSSTFSICSNEEWSAPQNCPAGTACTGAGLCTLQSGGGGNACTFGKYECVDEGLSPEYTLCGYDTDGALKRIPQSCPETTVCETANDSISCAVGASSGECSLTDRRCVGQSGFQTCIQGEDGGIWSEIQACGVGQTCNAGVCGFQSPGGGDDCVTGHMRCVEGDNTSFQQCDHGTWLAPQQCALGTLCESYMGSYVICNYDYLVE